MAIIATDGYRLSHLVKFETAPEMAFCREVVTFNGLAGDLKIGTVLGKVTAGGKYKVAVQSAVDGSQNFGALLLEDVTVVGATDKKVLVMTRGPASISKAALIFDATYDLAAEILAMTDGMEAKNIQVLDAT